MYLDEKSFTSPPVESKPDIYALPMFVAWLEKQPALAGYIWMNCHGKCLIGQYMSYHQNNGLYSSFVRRTREAGCDFQAIACPGPHTFGAALSRARALLP